MSGVFQFQGETFTVDLSPGSQAFVVTRDLVPCDYEISGESRTSQFQIGFGRTPPFEGGGGVDSASIVTDEGPNGERLSSCVIGWRTGSSRETSFRFRARFRVSGAGDCR
jgi:hypothetical protein